MATDPSRTPGYLVELAAAGELDPEARRAVLERASREQGADPLALLHRDDAATLARLAPENVAAAVARRSSRRGRRSWAFVPVLAAAGAAASLLWFPPMQNPRSRRSDVDGTRIKGRASPLLVVHRRTAGGAETIAPGATARPGDLLQLGYVAGRGFGVIVSIDGRGGVTRHWPLDGRDAGPLTSGREVLLPESFRLDDAPAFERFIFVTGEQPFDVAGVLDAARAVAARGDAREAHLPLAGELRETSVVVRKETR